MQAAELLGHPLLQPCVIKIHLKLNGPRRDSLGVQWLESDYIKKTRFSEAVSTYPEKRHSFTNDRTLNPSISGGEQDSLCSTIEIHDTPDYLNRRLAGLSIGETHKGVATRKKQIASKTSRPSPVIASATPRKWTEPLKKRVSVRPNGRLFLHMHKMVD